MSGMSIQATGFNPVSKSTEVPAPKGVNAEKFGSMSAADRKKLMLPSIEDLLKQNRDRPLKYTAFTKSPLAEDNSAGGDDGGFGLSEEG